MQKFDGVDVVDSNHADKNFKRKSLVGLTPTIAEEDEKELDDSLNPSDSSLSIGDTGSDTEVGRSSCAPAPLQLPATKRDSPGSGGHSAAAAPARNSAFSSRRRNQYAVSSSGLFSAVRRFTSRFSSLGSNSPLEHISGANPRDGTVPVHLGGVSDHTPERRYGTGRTTFFIRDRDSIGNKSSMTSDGDYSMDGTGFPTHTNSRKVCCLPDDYANAMRCIIYNQLWSSTTFFFTLVMLFGSQIQDLWLPKSWDAASDTVFTMAFVILSVDVIIRSIVDPMYFSWSFKRERRPSHSTGVGGLWIHRCDDINKISVGSFMFWCDVIATLTFLYDISYINPIKRNQLEQGINLTQFGVPVSSTPMFLFCSLCQKFNLINHFLLNFLCRLQGLV